MFLKIVLLHRCTVSSLLTQYTYSPITFASFGYSLLIEGWNFNAVVLSVGPFL